MRPHTRTSRSFARRKWLLWDLFAIASSSSKSDSLHPSIQNTWNLSHNHKMQHKITACCIHSLKPVSSCSVKLVAENFTALPGKLKESASPTFTKSELENGYAYVDPSRWKISYFCNRMLNQNRVLSPSVHRLVRKEDRRPGGEKLEEPYINEMHNASFCFSNNEICSWPESLSGTRKSYRSPLFKLVWKTRSIAGRVWTLETSLLTSFYKNFVIINYSRRKKVMDAWKKQRINRNKWCCGVWDYLELNPVISNYTRRPSSWTASEVRVTRSKRFSTTVLELKAPKVHPPYWPSFIFNAVSLTQTLIFPSKDI